MGRIFDLYMAKKHLKCVSIEIQLLNEVLYLIFSLTYNYHSHNMNKTKIIYTFLIACLFTSHLLSQDVNSGFRARSVPHGDPSIPTPSDNTERIKHTIKIEKDSVFYSLKAEMIEKGIINNGNIPVAIVSKTKVFKRNTINFEMFPDISNPVMMTLFTYFPEGVISYRRLYGDENKQIKYKKFESVDQSKYNHIPLLLCYLDDKQNNTEKLLAAYLKDNLITITTHDEIREKILKHIERCLFVYYTLTDN